MGQYLTYESIEKGILIDQNDEIMRLISSDGKMLTYVEDKEILKTTPVYVHQRWKVEIQPKDRFEKPFVTHRTIRFYIGEYADIFKPHRKVSEEDFPLEGDLLEDDDNCIF